MTTIHLEKSFEEEICEYLAGHGYLYSPDDTGYDRELALFPDDLAGWVRESQPKAWDALEKVHGGKVAALLARRTREHIDQVGTLTAIRGSIEMMGIRKGIPELSLLLPP